MGHLGFGELILLILVGAIPFAVKIGPLVAVVILWSRGRRLAERVEALERQLAAHPASGD